MLKQVIHCASVISFAHLLCHGALQTAAFIARHRCLAASATCGSRSLQQCKSPIHGIKATMRVLLPHACLAMCLHDTVAACNTKYSHESQELLQQSQHCSKSPMCGGWCSSTSQASSQAVDCRYGCGKMDQSSRGPAMSGMQFESFQHGGPVQKRCSCSSKNSCPLHWHFAYG